MTPAPDPSPAGPVDLNADLGEGFPEDEAILDVVSSASISCGAHAGTPDDRRRALRSAVARGVVVGAHPAFADPEHFGRRPLRVPPDELLRSILDQVGSLRALAEPLGASIRFLKPHGTLYNLAQRDPEIGAVVVEAARALDLPLLGMPRTPLEARARAAGVVLVPEGFPDRGYDAEGRLLPRDRPGAVVDAPDLVVENALRLVRDGVRTLCVHGDHPGAARAAAFLRLALEQRGIPVIPFADHPRGR